MRRSSSNAPRRGLDAELLGRFERDRRHRYLNDAVRSERSVLERVGGVPGLVEVALLERVGVHQERSARCQLADVGLQGSRVHRHEDGREVARRQDLVVGDVDLERRDAGDRPCRCADLSREVRHGRQVVAECSADVGEAIAGELHAVARVSGEPDDDVPDCLGLQVRGLGGHTPSSARRSAAGAACARWSIIGSPLGQGFAPLNRASRSGLGHRRSRLRAFAPARTAREPGPGCRRAPRDRPSAYQRRRW